MPLSVPEAPIYRVGPQRGRRGRGPLCVWHRNNREGTQAREPSKCLNGVELWRKTSQRGLLIASYQKLKNNNSKKQTNSDRAITPVAEAVRVPAHLVLGPLWPKQLHHLHAQPWLGQSFHRLCIYPHGVTSVVSNSLRPCGLWPARFLCQWGSPGKNTGVYWPILVPHSLLKHYISCCPSCQLPWVPGAARTPVTQAAAPPPYLALTGADPSPPGQPQE